jgi:hypothetical protein
MEDDRLIGSTLLGTAPWFSRRILVLRSRLREVTLGAALLLAARVASAQTAAGERSCGGQRVTAISIDPGRPPFAGSAKKWQAAARAVGLHHATTRAAVIRAYIVLHEGDMCTDERRIESERILRALPFLAAATVRAVPDTAGGVRLEIATTDEIPVLVAGAMHGAVPAALALGNSNIGGSGLRVFAGAERGYAYRNGAHLQVVQDAAFGQPLTASLDAAQDPLGGHVEVGVSHPFLTDLQHGSFQTTYRRSDDYAAVLRPIDDNAAVHLHQERWSIGGVVRTELGGLVALLGGAATGDRITPDADAVIVSDSGLLADTGSVLRKRYSDFRSTRLGGLIGVRRVGYTTVTGYDALFAEQDVMTGLQVGTFVAPGLVMGARHDILTANTAYAGVVAGRSVFGAQFEMEARRDFTNGLWDSMISSGRTAWYYKFAPRVLLTLNDEISIARRGLVPTQLTFSDPLGGVRGYAPSRLVGAERNVVRAEFRWAGPAAVRHADAGVALFADAGSLWAGDAPFGTTVSRQSIGLSVLAAYPTHSKRMYRVDFALPLERGGVRGIEVRFSSRDPTAQFWNEPDDVSRSRLAPVPSSLFAWPSR